MTVEYDLLLFFIPNILVNKPALLYLRPDSDVVFLFLLLEERLFKNNTFGIDFIFLLHQKLVLGRER